MEISSLGNINPIEKPTDVLGVNNVNTENNVSEKEEKSEKVETLDKLTEGVFRTTAAVYEGSWIQAQREILENGGKLEY